MKSLLDMAPHSRDTHPMILSHEAFIQQYLLSYAQGGITGGHSVPLGKIIDQADHAWEAIKTAVADAKDERAELAAKAKEKEKR